MPYIYKPWLAKLLGRERLSDPLAAVRHRQGRLVGRMEGLGFSLRNEAVLQTLTQDVMKTSEIEGEKLDQDQVRSSIARRLGIDIGALTPADRQRRGCRGDDARCDAALRRTLNRRAIVRMAFRNVPHGAQRHVQDSSWGDGATIGQAR